jgi:hypothetical protein
MNQDRNTGDLYEPAGPSNSKQDSAFVRLPTEKYDVPLGMVHSGIMRKLIFAIITEMSARNLPEW